MYWEAGGRYLDLVASFAKIEIMSAGPIPI